MQHSATTVLASDQIEFPVLVIKRNMLFIFTDWNQFTIGRREAFVRDAYSDLFILDSKAFGIAIVFSKKLNGVGFLRGWSLFGDQKIRLEYHVRNDGRKYELDEVKNLILSCFKKRPQWDDLDNLQAVKSSVESANSITEIIKVLETSPGTNNINSKWY